jgi:uncharacterized membrane protein
MNISEIKSLAKERLVGNHVLVVVLLFLNSTVAGILTELSNRFSPNIISYDPFSLVPNPNANPALSSLFSIGASVLAVFLGFALLKIMIDIVRKQKPNLTDCYASAFSDDPIKTIVTSILVGLFTFLWFLLLIVPGIIKAYSYGMYLYLLDVKRDLTASETIKESMKLMDGKKMDLFLLDLDYLLHYIIGIFTFGIYWLWVAPRHQVARVIFFEEVYNSAYPVAPTPTVDVEVE